MRQGIERTWRRGSRAGAIALVAACALACGSSETTGSGATKATSNDAGSTPSSTKVGAIRATLSYAGANPGQLAVAVFSENPPSSPPIAFDTDKAPAFPHVSDLTAIAPGRYWVVAVLDRPPYSPANLKPGPEDLQVTAGPVDVTADAVQAVTLTIEDGPADAGTDGDQ